jgi:hypothetical protein
MNGTPNGSRLISRVMLHNYKNIVSCDVRLGRLAFLLGPNERILLARGDLPMAAVIAVVEFEAWFLAAATSLAGVLDMRPDLSPPSMPEQVHDAKGWIKRNRLTGTYQPTIDQPKFAYHFSLAEAQSSRSFRKCYKEIRRILGGE